MVNASSNLPEDYWQNLHIGKQDLDFAYNYLFDTEIPLTETDLVPVLVTERIRIERESRISQRRGSGKVYIPKDDYKVGEHLVFPGLSWKKGIVKNVRPGKNPDINHFKVITVEFDDKTMQLFASGLSEHKLNIPVEVGDDDPLFHLDNVMKEYGASLETRLVSALDQDNNLVRIAGRWFPRALLVDVNVGHLNLAEAVLDEANGHPLPTTALLDQVELPADVNPKLVEFSMNFALQEDSRFDEVGPAGEVYWCLKRLEPDDVKQVPVPLRYSPIEYDRSHLTDEIHAFDGEIDDELAEAQDQDVFQEDVILTLSYPHWRSGTLPISSRVKRLFPTAYESPRVRFTLVDAQTNQEMPGWVVRQHRYVSGLRQFYEKYGVFPGSLISIKKGKKPGQVVISAKSRRQTRDWIRTVLVGSDGGLVFALLRQNISTEYNEQMVVYVTDVDGVDRASAQAAKGRLEFGQIVKQMMRELIKLNVQGHVHARELYSVVNIIRRCPPAPLLVFLMSQPDITHVGDLYFRLVDPEANHA